MGMQDSKTSNEEDDPNKKKSIGFYLAVVVIFSIFFQTYDLIIHGVNIDEPQFFGRNAILSALCWWYVWKKLGKNQILGVAIGVLAYVIVIAVATIMKQ